MAEVNFKIGDVVFFNGNVWIVYDKGTTWIHNHHYIRLYGVRSWEGSTRLKLFSHEFDRIKLLGRRETHYFGPGLSRLKYTWSVK